MWSDTRHRMKSNGISGSHKQIDHFNQLHSGLCVCKPFEYKAMLPSAAAEGCRDEAFHSISFWIRWTTWHSRRWKRSGNFCIAPMEATFTDLQNHKVDESHIIQGSHPMCDPKSLEILSQVRQTHLIHTSVSGRHSPGPHVSSKGPDSPFAPSTTT